MVVCIYQQIKTMDMPNSEMVSSEVGNYIFKDEERTACSGIGGSTSDGVHLGKVKPIPCLCTAALSL